MKPNIRKTLPVILCLASLLLGVATIETACNTTQQTNTYKTLYSVEGATVTAYDAYMDQVIKHKVRTNELPQISRDFNVFQNAMLTATELAQFDTNAIAPPNIQILGLDLINTINAATKKSGP